MPPIACTFTTPPPAGRGLVSWASSGSRPVNEATSRGSVRGGAVPPTGSPSATRRPRAAASNLALTGSCSRRPQTSRVTVAARGY